MSDKKIRVRFVGVDTDVLPTGATGTAYPDRLAHVSGHLYEGAWYFTPDDMPEEMAEWGEFIVDASDLETLDGQPVE